MDPEIAYATILSPDTSRTDREEATENLIEWIARGGHRPHTMPDADTLPRVLIGYYFYLLRDGNLRVLGSRYGHDTRTCAPVAIYAALDYCHETGDEITQDLLDEFMGLVVNDHDDIAEWVPEHLYE